MQVDHMARQPMLIDIAHPYAPRDPVVGNTEGDLGARGSLPAGRLVWNIRCDVKVSEELHKCKYSGMVLRELHLHLARQCKDSCSSQ